jgi:hypothetical protein
MGFEVPRRFPSIFEKMTPFLPPLYHICPSTYDSGLLQGCILEERVLIFTLGFHILYCL